MIILFEKLKSFLKKPFPYCGKIKTNVGIKFLWFGLVITMYGQYSVEEPLGIIIMLTGLLFLLIDY